MSVTSVWTLSPQRLPVSRNAVASVWASGSVFMKAPEPHFTSMTTVSAPPASFLLRIDETMSGTLAMVPVASRNAYSTLSAGAKSGLCPVKARPMRPAWATNS